MVSFLCLLFIVNILSFYYSKTQRVFLFYAVLLFLFCDAPDKLCFCSHVSTHGQYKSFQCFLHEIVHHAAIPPPAQLHSGCGTRCLTVRVNPFADVYSKPCSVTYHTFFIGAATVVFFAK